MLYSISIALRIKKLQIMKFIKRISQSTKILIGCDADLDYLFEKEAKSYYVSPNPSTRPLSNLLYYGNDEKLKENAGTVNFEINFGLDNPVIKLGIYNNFKANGFDLLSSKAEISKSAVWDEGLICQSKTYIGPNVILGKFVKLNVGAQIHHDVAIGDFCTIAPGAIVLGGSTIGSCSFVGAGAVILPKLSVGDRVTVGAGAVVTRHIQTGEVVKGIPAR